MPNFAFMNAMLIFSLEYIAFFAKNTQYEK